MRIRHFLVVFLTFAFSISSAFADPGDDDPIPCPGDPSDPGWTPDGCHLPLDTWVYILVIAAVIYGAYKLHQKQKALTA